MCMPVCKALGEYCKKFGCEGGEGTGYIAFILCPCCNNGHFKHCLWICVMWQASNETGGSQGWGKSSAPNHCLYDTLLKCAVRMHVNYKTAWSEQSSPEELFFQWGRKSGRQFKEDFPLEGMALWQNQKMLPSCNFYSGKTEMCPNLIAGTCSHLHSKVKWRWNLCARWRSTFPDQRTWNCTYLLFVGILLRDFLLIPKKPLGSLFHGFYAQATFCVFNSDHWSLVKNIISLYHVPLCCIYYIYVKPPPPLLDFKTLD